MKSRNVSKSCLLAGLMALFPWGLAQAVTVTAGTTAQTADAVERLLITNRDFAFGLNKPVMGHTDADGRVIGPLPADVSLTSVVLYDLADVGEASLSRANLPTVSVLSGDTLLGTANYTGAREPIEVFLADGSTLSLRPVVYDFTAPVSVNATGTYTLRLNAAGVTPSLPLFTNAASNAGFNISSHREKAPYVSFVCDASVTTVLKTVSGEAASLSSLGITDTASTVAVITLEADATLMLDQSVSSATLIFETDAPAANAPTVAFTEGAILEGSFVFRNAQGSDNGAIRVTGTWQNSASNDSFETWVPNSENPDAVTVDCDLILASPLPLIASGWFQANDIRVRPGRTLRLETEANTPDRLPGVLLTAPTATLALADTGKTGGLPAKYSDLFTGTSGTVTLERPVAFDYAGNESDSQGSIFRIGNDEGKGYNFTLNVDKDFSSASRLVIGGESGFTTLNLRGDATYSAKTINFDSNSQLVQSAGNLTLGSPSRNGWATWFLGDSSTLVFGDGDTENGLATATLHGIPYGSNDKTDYRGAADLTVNADATLLLNEYDLPAVASTPDYALYPVGKRSLKVRGGTVKANTGAAVTMVFENPEPQAAPMAVAEIPGLEVVDAANLESSDTASSSLTLDALKGNGAVTLSGVVHIDSVRLGEDDTLTFDLRKGTDGADDAIGGSRVTIDAVTGTAGTVRFGLLGTDGTTGEQIVINTLLAGGFTGTVGFLVPDYSTLDFEDTQLPELPFTLEVQPGQTVVMRLDQYADADILWPEDCSNVNLVLVEAGPFGGEASLPAWPQDVTMEFHRYDGSSEGHSALPGEDYDATRNDDGLTIDLTWKDPVLTGKVAWVDVEFNGNSYNTGWFRLKGPNGETGDSYNAMFDGTEHNPELVDSYTETFNPAGQGANPRKQPYIPVTALENYPDSWSIVARVTAAEFTKSVMLAIGANYKDVTGGTGDDFSDRDTLVLATGSMKDHGVTGLDAGADDDNDRVGDTVRLWLIRGRDLYASNLPDEYLAQAELPQLTEMPHLYTITYDNRHIQVYVDGHCLMDETLPEDINLGPGLQVGKLMGGANIDSDHLEVGGKLAEQFRPVTSNSGDGVVDFIRIYRGVLSDTAIDRLVRDNPYIHKDPGGSSNHRDVRYRRVIQAGKTEHWVQSNAWIREYMKAGGDLFWYDDYGSGESKYYDEPAEGAIVVIEVEGNGEATLLVNTEKGGLFPSANRVYSTLIVSGKDIDPYYIHKDWSGGRLILAPIGYVAEEQAIGPEWEDKLEDGAFKYGTLRFSGGAGQRIQEHHTTLGSFFNPGRSKAAYFLTNTHFYASIVDLNSKDGVASNENVEVRAFVDESMLRGHTEEVLVRQITGPVVTEDLLDYGQWERNRSVTMAEITKQRSDYVYPDLFHEDRSAWLFSDATLEHNPGLELYNAPQVGLFVEAMKIPGRLYLELNADDIQGNGELSQQEWYRYGYNGDSESETMSGYAPLKALEGDFEKAIALSIRLNNGEEKTLYADSVADRLIINELTIDKPKADDGTANETLRILPQAGTDNSLKVLESISTDRRLEVYSAQGTGSEASATGADGVKLHAVYDEATETNIGAKLYGVGTGAFVAGNSSINHALDGSSIARIESEGTIRFAAAQDLSATTVAAAKEAIVEQTGADNAFRAKAMELAQGSRFRFASSAATVDEGITLTGNATLEGTGTAAALTPTEGVKGQAGTETLTLDAADGADWKLLNREVGGLPLTKVGAGVADIATDLPPNAGFVDVQKGTLAVATGLAGEGQAVGQKSLKVAEGATLAPTSGTIADDVLAEIPAGQSVSGLGRIGGWLRLTQGATLAADDVRADASLSVGGVLTDGLEALADVSVTLPATTAEGLVFLRSDEEALNWAARKRLAAATVAEPSVSWDVALRYAAEGSDSTETEYLTVLPGIDKPAYPGDETNPEGKPNDDGDPDDDYSEGVQDDLDDQYHNAGMLGGASQGYTRANTTRLSAGGVENAYTCFNNVWTLAQRTSDETSVEYATVDLLLAYEFGISAMRRVTATDGTDQLLVTVTLRNALGAAPFADTRLLNGADGLKPTYAVGVALSFALDDKPVDTVKEISAAVAREEYGVAEEATLDASRYFLIPYSEAFLGQGLTVRAAKAAAPAE